MTSFCRAANFRQLLQSKTLPHFLRSLIPVVQSFFGRADLHSSLMTDVLPSNPDRNPEHVWDTEGECNTLPYDTYHLLLARINASDQPRRFASYYHREPGLAVLDSTIQERQTLDLNGVLYRPSHPRSQKFRGDSLIQFTHLGQTWTGSITSMFIHSRTADRVVEFFAAVDVFGELSEAESALDPYRRYPLLQVKLCRTEVTERVVIKSSDIISHFASCPYSNGYQVVVSLDRSGELIPDITSDYS